MREFKRRVAEWICHKLGFGYMFGYMLKVPPVKLIHPHIHYEEISSSFSAHIDEKIPEDYIIQILAHNMIDLLIPLMNVQQIGSREIEYRAKLIVAIEKN